MKKIFISFITLFSGLYLQAQELALGGVAIVQDEKQVVHFRGTSAVELESKPFSIQFVNRKYTDDQPYAAKVWVSLEKIKGSLEGKVIDEIPFLSPGTGWATELGDAKHYLQPSKEGHHYLFYENSIERNIQKIGNWDAWDIFEWTIDGIYYKEKEMSFKDAKFKNIYIYVVIDLNLDGEIDAGEHHLFEIRLK